ncbi:hypothetical protein A4X13_0g6681 [Tilletia indica]|uniref:Uncharacterized protein n=1 Tax=Tilletia indica TaxID=43049 RepID=A0A8T8SN12_9BASI|nr:hypothetical protein A4X13_0g6681 [Tilletia indica]
MSSRQPPSPTPTVASQDEEMTLPETFLASRPYPCRQRPGPNSYVHEITWCSLMLLLTRSLQANNNHLLAQTTHTLGQHMHTSTCTLSTHQAPATTRTKSTQTTYKVTAKNQQIRR